MDRASHSVKFPCHVEAVREGLAVDAPPDGPLQRAGAAGPTGAGRDVPRPNRQRRLHPRRRGSLRRSWSRGREPPTDDLPGARGRRARRRRALPPRGFGRGRSARRGPGRRRRDASHRTPRVRAFVRFIRRWRTHPWRRGRCRRTRQQGRWRGIGALEAPPEEQETAPHRRRAKGQVGERAG